jgi:hypothetical protein
VANLGVDINASAKPWFASCNVIVIIDFTDVEDLEMFINSEEMNKKLDVDREDFWICFIN